MIDAEDIKNRHNIIDVIGAVVDIKKKGADHFGCCPFHNEKTPSFSVSERKQFYHCFGCGANGSVIDFVMEYQGVGYVEACQILGHNAALNPGKSAANIQQARRRAINLPLNAEPVGQDELKAFFGKCQLMERPSSSEAIYFYNGCQAVMLTDTHRNPVSAALVRSDIKPRYYGGRFLFGSCAIFGEINGEVLLCEYWHDAVKAHNIGGKNAVCFFEPGNIRFIYSEIKHKCTLTAACKTDEGRFQADNLNLELGEVGND